MANPIPSHGAGLTSTKLNAGALIRKSIISDLADAIELITEEGEEMDRLRAENEQLRNELSKRPAPAAASTEQPAFLSARVSSAYSRITIPSNSPDLACKVPPPAHSSSHPFDYCPAFQAPMRKDCFFDGTPTTYFDLI
ncbi:hypothetical protein I350_02603 [Cryptococcus amylolentus CBS 6273]|uniref:Uncharacterized protein n=1 Tax=Cryptococcus amylolentus CBS 6273 TaxID=1296118 RepID=A0A1E3K730_9TREE|nr:hypothetical protein I350_02603 [Cryptococcus amylolentus CBS 6273]